MEEAPRLLGRHTKAWRWQDALRHGPSVESGLMPDASKPSPASLSITREKFSWRLRTDACG